MTEIIQGGPGPIPEGQRNVGDIFEQGKQVAQHLRQLLGEEVTLKDITNNPDAMEFLVQNIRSALQPEKAIKEED